MTQESWRAGGQRQRPPGLRASWMAAGILGAVMLASSPTAADTLTGRVIRVVDGDTVALLDEHANIQKIRLAGIDSPECGMPYGPAAKTYLEDLVLGKTVQAFTTRHDRYWRTVATLVLDGHDVGLALVQAGMAWNDRRYPVVHHGLGGPADYGRAEQEARWVSKGLWQQSAAMPPWLWRAVNKGPGSGRIKCKSAVPNGWQSSAQGVFF